MNILYTITSYLPAIGGAQVHSHELIKRLLSNNQIRVISQWDTFRNDWLIGTTLKAPSKDRDYQIEGVNVHRLSLSSQDKVRIFPYVISYYLTMHQSINIISDLLVRKIDIYATNTDLIHNCRMGREGLSFASLKLARKRNIPFVFTSIHHPRWIGWRYKKYHNLYKKADAVIASSEGEKETLSHLGVNEDKIFVIERGPVLFPKHQKGIFGKKHNIRGQMVLFLGQKYRYKGVEEILKAARIVWKKNSEVSFVFIGPRTKYSQRLFSKRHDPRIVELGTVNLEDKTNALADCDVFCLPSTQESFGGVYTEAWMLEKPVIGCNIPSVKSVITNGHDGILVDQNFKEIADSLLYLLEDKSTGIKMGQEGKKKVLAKYTWEKIAQKTEDVYKQVLKG